ncbi:MAG: hypothetical protein WDM90_07880 [Ferruginibacter sp.]
MELKLFKSSLKLIILNVKYADSLLQYYANSTTNGQFERWYDNVVVPYLKLG